MRLVLLLLLLISNQDLTGQEQKKSNTKVFFTGYQKLPVENIEYSYSEYNPSSEPPGTIPPGDSWRKLEKSVFYANHSDQFIWLRMELDSPELTSKEWYLDVDWPFFDHISLFIREKGQKSWSYSSRIEAWREIPRDRNPYPFSFKIPAGERDPLEIYLRVHSQSKILLPISILSESEFFRSNLNRTLLTGGFFGILVVMFFYNLLIGIAIGNRTYMIYVIYVFSILLYALGMTGAGAGFVWKENIWINNHSYGLFSSISFFMATLFIREFLNLRKDGSWLLRLSDIFLVFWLLISVVYLTGTYSWLLILEDIGAFASGAAGLITSIRVWMKGDKSGKYLTIAWSPLIISTMILMLGLTGTVPYSSSFRVTQNTGFFIEVILLSLALGYRIKSERARAMAAEKRAKAELTLKVEEKTFELQKTLTALEKANNILARQSRTDGLTLLANRWHFDETISREFKRAKRQGTPLSIILGDIDHFKIFNDTYGHQTGDQCLKFVADFFRKAISREEDLCARYGGEEFVAVLPGTDPDSAKGLAEKIRKELEATPLSDHNEEIRITMSLGVCGGIPTRNETSDSYLAKADKALYKAKNNGRNQVRTC